MQFVVIHYLLIVRSIPQKTNTIIIKDCIKNFSKELKKHAEEIINHIKMKMIPL